MVRAWNLSDEELTAEYQVVYCRLKVTPVLMSVEEMIFVKLRLMELERELERRRNGKGSLDNAGQ